MRPRSLLVFVAFAITVLGLSHAHAQTSQTATADAHSLGGTSWQLAQFQGSDDKLLQSDDKAKYTIAFAADGGVSVRIDCNRGHGTWKSSGPGQLEFGPLALTRAMCPPAPLTDRLTKDWTNVRSYTIKDGHLFLSLIADGGTYEFEPVNPKETEPLENINWQLIRLGDALVKIDAQRQRPYLTFSSEPPRITGSGGCNRLTGGYRRNGDRLTFSQIASTRMACLQGMETEQAFLQALEHVSKWKVVGEELELFDDNGNPVARFEARPAN